MHGGYKKVHRHQDCLANILMRGQEMAIPGRRVTTTLKVE